MIFLNWLFPPLPVKYCQILNLGKRMHWLREIWVNLSTLSVPSLQRSPLEQSRVDRLASQLTLYVMDNDSPSKQVRRELKNLNINLTIKNLKRCHTYQKELLSGGGQAQVPCLRIECTKNTQWMYDSHDIIDYLNSQFASKSQDKRLEQAH